MQSSTTTSEHSSKVATSLLVTSQRLDAALAARSLARSRSHAATLITEGFVRVGGKVINKPAFKVEDNDDISVDGADHYVSRAAHKLIAGLDGFDIDVSGRAAFDVGASTGGFTQVLLERGAQPVVALDVGHSQLSPRIRSDERVFVVEGVNAKGLDREKLSALVKQDFVADVGVADVGLAGQASENRFGEADVALQFAQLGGLLGQHRHARPGRGVRNRDRRLHSAR